MDWLSKQMSDVILSTIQHHYVQASDTKSSLPFFWSWICIFPVAFWAAGRELLKTDVAEEEKLAKEGIEKLRPVNGYK